MAKPRQKESITSEGLPLLGVDMGSSCFKTFAADETDPSNPDGSTLRILAFHESNKNHCLKKGIIVNSSEASYMLRESILLISNKLNFKEPLPTAFCLLGGKSLRCAHAKVTRNQGYLAAITQSFLDEMKAECLAKVERMSSKMPLVGLAARPISFEVDDQSVPYLQPGTRLHSVTGHYSVFCGMNDIKDKTQGAFDRAGKSIEQAFARPEALLQALATERDELVGVAIIDMGAETTTISIFKNNQFLSTQVVPLGGDNITRDIQQTGISIEDAEKLKIRFGSTFKSTQKQAIRVRNAQPNEPPVIIPTDFLSEIITARLDEIMAPIFAELHKYDAEIGQVYITGGASKLAHMVDYIQQHTPLPVAYGSHADWLDSETDPKYFGPEYSAAIGALLLGAKFRREHPGKKLPNTPLVRGTNRITHVIANLFTQNQ